MAKTKRQKEKAELSEKCANVLVEFLNAHTLQDAVYSLYWIFLLVFRVPTFDPEVEFQRRGRKCIRKAQQQLSKLFDVLQEDKLLEKSDAISDYNFDFFCLGHCAVAPDARDIEETDKFACFEADCRTPFEAVLAFCVHYYIQDENRKPIFKCQYNKCGQYFVAEKITRKFCSPTHKTYQNRIVKDSMKLKMSETKS